MAIVIGPHGAATLAADEAWEKYRESRGIKSPWDEEEAIRRKYTSYSDNIWRFSTDYFPEDKEKIKVLHSQRGAYRKMEYEWELLWLLENYGYEFAEHFAHLRDDTKLWPNHLIKTFESLMPCKYNCDCTLMCKRFEKCVEEGFVV